MKKIIGILTIFFSFMTLPMIACNEKEMTDRRDGHVYKTVKIGKQLWLAENLAYKSEDSYPPNGDYFNISTYGRLYTWQAAQTVCPKRWHLPSKEEFERLLVNVCGRNSAGEIKSKGCREKLNTIGFNILTAGDRWNSGDYENFGSFANLWSSTPVEKDLAYSLYVYSFGALVGSSGRIYAFSVRCVKD